MREFGKDLLKLVGFQVLHERLERNWCHTHSEKSMGERRAMMGA
jgi:hypothetical protein